MANESNINRTIYTGKTWKVIEFIIVISGPGKSCNLSEGHGKSWKSNMLPVKRQKN